MTAKQAAYLRWLEVEFGQNLTTTQASQLIIKHDPDSIWRIFMEPPRNRPKHIQLALPLEYSA